MKTFHFISGLPRSGSTLLSALLRQNPRIHAGIASPLGPLYGIVSSNLSANNEVYASITDQARRDVLRGLFENYYRSEKRELVFDSGRYWCSKMAALATLFPDAKILCLVRPIQEIVDSLERLLDRNALEASALFGFRGDGSVQSRFDHLKSSKGIIGTSLNNLRQAFFGRHSERILLLQYSSLVRDPVKSLQEIYDFIGEPWFEHDTENFEFDAAEIDRRLGAKGLHHVKGPVFNRQDELPHLPPEIIKACQHLNFWLGVDVVKTKARIW